MMWFCLSDARWEGGPVGAEPGLGGFVEPLPRPRQVEMNSDFVFRHLPEGEEITTYDSPGSAASLPPSVSVPALGGPSGLNRPSLLFTGLPSFQNLNGFESAPWRESLECPYWLASPGLAGSDITAHKCLKPQ